MKGKIPIIIMATLLLIGVAVSDLDNSDLNAVCNTNNSYLYKDKNGDWGCLNSNQLNITTTGDITARNLNLTGNLSVKRPYAMFSDMTTQNITSTGTATPVNFNTTEDAYQITITNKQNISVQQQGDYLIEISAIVKSQNTNKRVEIWIRKNGVDIPRSNTIYDFKGINTVAVISVPFIIDLQTTDNFQVMWAGNDNTISMEAVTATGYSPATPSIIMTMNKISEITP